MKTKTEKSKVNDEFDFFNLDKDRLDEEWVNQPLLYQEYAIKLANARAKHEQAKTELELVTAELDSQIRGNPSVFGIEKTTEGAISNTILLQKEYKTAVNDMLELKHTMDVLQAVVYALDHRKKSLENLVELRLADYFSSPQTKSNGSHEQMEESRRKRLFKPIRKDEVTSDD